MGNLYNKPDNEHIYKDLEKIDKYKNIKIPKEKISTFPPLIKECQLIISHMKN